MFKFNNLGYIVVAKRMHLALEAMQCLIEFLIWTICIIKIRNSFAMVSIFVGLPWQSGIPVKVFMWFGKGYIFLAVYKPFIWYLFKPLSKLTSTRIIYLFFLKMLKAYNVVIYTSCEYEMIHFKYTYPVLLSYFWASTYKITSCFI